MNEFESISEFDNLFSPLGLEAKSDFDHKTSKLKPHSVRVSERYMNDKNPIHVRETALIFRLNAESFELYLDGVLHHIIK